MALETNSFFWPLKDVESTLRKFRAGDIIFNQGEAGHELFIVKKGKVELRIGNHVLEVLSDQNVFGELALIDSVPRSATAVAVTDATLIAVGRVQFMSLVSNFALNVMREISRRLRNQARANELMNIDAVTASIAHEIKQPLAAIAASCGAAQRFLATSPPDLREAQALLTNIASSVHRSGEMLDGIRLLFRREGRARQQIDLNEIVLDVLKTASVALENHDVTVLSELDGKIPPVAGNRAQLRQVLANIVQNAIEAMSATVNKRRVLRVKTEFRDNEITVSVEDSGSGIDPKIIERIFDAFVTTKSYGTGLGLAICRMIVEHHAGRLVALSNGKEGALVQVVLPCA